MTIAEPSRLDRLQSIKGATSDANGDVAFSFDTVPSEPGSWPRWAYRVRPHLLSGRCRSGPLAARRDRRNR